MVCTCTEFAERYNFAAGPAMLPAEVLTQIREEMPDWRGSGSSILEQPFTSAAFKGLMEEVEADLRTLLSIPRSYRVLFLQGGASAQFGLLPLNLLHPRQSADYLESGHWARRAISEARRHARVNVIASAAAQSFTALPSFEQWRSSPDAGYCHITSNETGNGLQLRDFPQLAVPLVADMTSDFLTRPIPVDRFGLIYASAQKNLGIAGLCVVIVHQNLLRRPPRHLPAAFSYAVQAEQQSRFNTPPTFALYVAGLMLRWIRQNGGLPAMDEAAQRRSRELYRYANEVAQLGVMHNGAARLGISLTLDARQASAESRAMLRAAWPHADYLMLNLIGPTSAPLLSQSTRLRHLLAALVDEQRQLNQDGRRRVPLLAKLRCMPERTPFSIAGLLVELGFDGLLAAHDPGPPATAERYRAWQDPRRQAQACQQIEDLRRFCGPDMALLSVGGVQTADHLRARMSAGAELVQVHTAFMHQSPWLARRLLR